MKNAAIALFKANQKNIIVLILTAVAMISEYIIDPNNPIPNLLMKIINYLWSVF